MPCGLPHSLTFSCFTCLSSPILLRRHSFATTLGLIAAALRSTRRDSVAHFLHVIVSIVVHLPLAELLPLGVKVASLQESEVELNRRRYVAVRA